MDMLSNSFGGIDEVRNRTMNNEVCKKGSEEPGEIKARSRTHSLILMP